MALAHHIRDTARNGDKKEDQQWDDAKVEQAAHRAPAPTGEEDLLDRQ